jgi:high-affinity iron transporter
MLPSYLLSLREGLEAALIIGIALGALTKMKRGDLAPALWAGTLSAVVTSLLGAAILTRLGLSLAGAAEQVFEGITMLLAAGLLTWMIFWMDGQGRHLRADLEAGIGRAAATSGKRAMFSLAFLAVVREGIELALFLTASFFVGNNAEVASNTIQTLAGAILGLGTAVLLGWTLFATTVRLDLHRFFQATGALLVLFAAGLVAHGVHEFNEVGWIPGVIEPIWDVNALVDEGSLPGQLLKTLFGYNGNPSLTEMLFYFAFLAAVVAVLRRRRPVAARAPTAAG